MTNSYIRLNFFSSSPYRECLIYSFGSPTTNLTFEVEMLKIGCIVKMGFTSKLDLKLEELVKKLADQYDKLYHFKNVEL